MKGLRSRSCLRSLDKHSPEVRCRAELFFCLILTLEVLSSPLGALCPLSILWFSSDRGHGQNNQEKNKLNGWVLKVFRWWCIAGQKNALLRGTSEIKSGIAVFLGNDAGKRKMKPKPLSWKTYTASSFSSCILCPLFFFARSSFLSAFWFQFRCYVFSFDIFFGMWFLSVICNEAKKAKFTKTALTRRRPFPPFPPFPFFPPFLSFRFPSPSLFPSLFHFLFPLLFLSFFLIRFLSFLLFFPFLFLSFSFPFPLLSYFLSFFLSFPVLFLFLSSFSFPYTDSYILAGGPGNEAGKPKTKPYTIPSNRTKNWRSYKVLEARHTKKIVWHLESLAASCQQKPTPTPTPFGWMLNFQIHHTVVTIQNWPYAVHSFQIHLWLRWDTWTLDHEGPWQPRLRRWALVWTTAQGWKRSGPRGRPVRPLNH